MFTLIKILWNILTGAHTHLKWLKERDKEYSLETTQYSRYSDPWLIFTILALMSIGLTMVYSASIVRSGVVFKNPEHFFHNQVGFMIGGLFCMWLVSKIPYQVWGNFAYVNFTLSILLLCLVFSPLGKSVNGAHRWINFGFNFQPVEWVKVTWIIILCHYHSHPHLNMASKKTTLIPLLMALTFTIPLSLQPDLGSIIVLGFIFFISFYLAGGFIRNLIIIGFVPAIVLIFFMFKRFGHIINRINSFMAQFTDPQDMDYNVKQALISFGSGRWFGVGVGQSSQKGFFLPEAHTDFIFDIYGEEFGLVGVVILVGLYMCLFLRGLYIARHAPTVFGSHLAALVSIMILAQALINMSMAIGLLPTKGLTLPLVSYGGSSIIITCVALGILLNISRKTPPSRFSFKLIEWSRKFPKARRYHFHQS